MGESMMGVLTVRDSAAELVAEPADPPETPFALALLMLLFASSGLTFLRSASVAPGRGIKYALDDSAKVSNKEWMR